MALGAATAAAWWRSSAGRPAAPRPAPRAGGVAAACAGARSRGRAAAAPLRRPPHAAGRAWGAGGGPCTARPAHVGRDEGSNPWHTLGRHSPHPGQLVNLRPIPTSWHVQRHWAACMAMLRRCAGPPRLCQVDAAAVHLRRARHARGAVKRGLDGRQRVAGAPGRHHARGRQRVLAGGQGYGRSGVRREVPGRRCRQGLPHPARVGASVRSGLARREAGASQGLVAT